MLEYGCSVSREAMSGGKGGGCRELPSTASCLPEVRSLQTLRGRVITSAYRGGGAVYAGVVPWSLAVQRLIAGKSSQISSFQ
jgi:hypothetical protein